MCILNTPRGAVGEAIKCFHSTSLKCLDNTHIKVEMKSCLYANISSHWSCFLKHVISVTNFLQHILGHLVQKLDLGALAILDHYPYVSK